MITNKQASYIINTLTLNPNSTIKKKADKKGPYIK